MYDTFRLGHSRFIYGVLSTVFPDITAQSIIASAVSSIAVLLLYSTDTGPGILYLFPWIASIPLRFQVASGISLLIATLTNACAAVSVKSR